MRFIKNTSHVVNFISSGEGQYQYLSLFVTMSTILITIIIASPIDHNYLYDQILSISQMYLQESETPVNLSCKNSIDSGEIGHDIRYKISPENSSEIINLKFCWIVDNQIQVGKLLTVYAESNSVRYVQNSTKYENITITFPQNMINYWIDDKHPRQNKYDETNVLTLYYDNHTKIFKSEPINIRFTVPDNVSVLYCEYTHEEKCFTVKNILKPAEYSLEQEIKNNELLINLTVIIAILTLIPPVSTIYKIFRSNSRIRSALKFNMFNLKFQRKDLEAFIAIIILFTGFTLYVLFIISIIMGAL